MEKEVSYRVLEIVETKDEQALRMAYLRLLKKTNPEDDPEGFKRLRLAYETALAFAGQRGTETGAKMGTDRKARDTKDAGGSTREAGDAGRGAFQGDGRTDEARGEDSFGDGGRPNGKSGEVTKLSQWMGKVEACVGRVETRIDEKMWKELLKDPVCDSLDYSLNARELLLAFLMSHMYLPRQIWKLIDDCFDIAEDYDVLEEKFPANFLNYVKYYVENQGFIPYELFKTPDDGPENLDGYLEHYFSIKKKVDQNQYKGCSRELDDLAAFGLYHPYEDVERIRILLAEDEIVPAVSLADKLETGLTAMGTAMESAPYIWVFVGHVRFREGRKDAAYALWMGILERFPDYYQAKKGAVIYLTEQKRYWKARELLLEMLEMDGQDDEILEQLILVNQSLMERLWENTAYEEEGVNIPSEEGRIELGWCLFQNEMLPEAIEYLEGIIPAEEQRYGYVNLFGRVLYQSGRFKEARSYLKEWLQMICEAPDDGSKENARIRSRKGRALNLLSSCCFELGQKEEAQRYISQAAETAANVKERLGSLQYLAHMMVKEREYEHAVDVCDQIIKEEENYYPAYVTRLEACYELRRWQEVVDDYQKAVDIYAGFYKPYLLAAQVFFYHDQFEDAKAVVERAMENEVEFSVQMKLFQVKILRNLTDSNEERSRLMEMIQGLKEAAAEERAGKEGAAGEFDLEDLSELDFELALLCWDSDLLSDALNHLNAAIGKNRERLQYRMVRGDIYLSMKKYKESLTDLAEAEPVYGSSPGLHYSRAVCYEAGGMINLAIESYKEANRLEEGYRDACEKLADHYKERYQDEYKPEDYRLALEYINRQIAVRKNPSTLMSRGLVYMSAMELDAAIADFDKALELDGKNWSAYNNLGCCYKYLGRFEEALENFKKALEYMEPGRSHLPYSNMADCYEALGHYEKAIACYRRAFNDFPEYTAFWKEIGLLYSYMGDYRQAKQAYSHTKAMADYYERIGDLCFLEGDCRRGIYFYRKWITKADEKSEAGAPAVLAFRKHIFTKANDERGRRYRALGTVYLYQIGNPGKAETCLKRAVQSTGSAIQLFECELDLAWLYYLTERDRQAKKHAELALGHFERSGCRIEEYIGFGRYEAVRKGLFGRLYLALGEKEKGLALIRQMDEGHSCLHCRYRGCYERFLFLGQYYERQGLTEQAQKAYEQAKQLNPASLIVAGILKNLQKKVGRQK